MTKRETNAVDLLIQVTQHTECECIHNIRELHCDGCKLNIKITKFLEKNYPLQWKQNQEVAHVNGKSFSDGI